VNAQQKFIGLNHGNVNGSTTVMYICEDSAVNVHGVNALCNVKPSKDGYFVLAVLRRADTGGLDAGDSTKVSQEWKETVAWLATNAKGLANFGNKAVSSSRIWGIVPATAGGDNAQLLEIAPKTSRNLKKGDIIIAGYTSFDYGINEANATVLLQGFASS